MNVYVLVSLCKIHFFLLGHFRWDIGCEDQLAAVYVVQRSVTQQNQLKGSKRNRKIYSSSIFLKNYYLRIQQVYEAIENKNVYRLLCMMYSIRAIYMPHSICTYYIVEFSKVVRHSTPLPCVSCSISITAHIQSSVELYSLAHNSYHRPPMPPTINGGVCLCVRLFVCAWHHIHLEGNRRCMRSFLATK